MEVCRLSSSGVNSEAVSAGTVRSRSPAEQPSLVTQVFRQALEYSKAGFSVGKWVALVPLCDVIELIYPENLKTSKKSDLQPRGLDYILRPFEIQAMGGVTDIWYNRIRFSGLPTSYDQARTYAAPVLLTIFCGCVIKLNHIASQTVGDVNARKKSNSESQNEEKPAKEALGKEFGVQITEIFLKKFFFEPASYRELAIRVVQNHYIYARAQLWYYYALSFGQSTPYGLTTRFMELLIFSYASRYAVMAFARAVQPEEATGMISNSRDNR